MNSSTRIDVNDIQRTSSSAVRQNARCLALCLLLVGVLTVWFVTSYHGYSVAGADASANQFSGGRALAVLSEMLGDQSPHPAGSAANAEVRQWLVTHLEGLGLQVEQTPFVVNDVAMCNLLAVVPGDSSQRPILLATHYDSVGQGPGVGDAGCCVAALLEIARVLNEQRLLQPNRQLFRDVYFLLTDGEEWVRDIGHGLNGATHFVETEPHPLFARNPIVLNFDARGAAGPSLLYETSGNNSQLLQHLLPALPRRAFTASSYVTVYDLLPNATDFTIFKNGDLEGLNFAFIGDPHRYHTPEDSLEFLDPRSVQHHGENGLAVTLHLLDSAWPDFASNQNAVFFTLFGQWVICYPEKYAVWFAAVLLVAQLLGTRISLRHGAEVSEMLAAVFAILLTFVLSVAGGLVVLQFDKFRSQSFHGFGAFDPWIVGLLWLLAGCSAFVMLRLFASRVSTESTWACIWLGTAIAGLLVSIYLPGFSYVMLFTGVVPAILSLLPHGKARLSVVAVTAASLISIPLAYQFGVALGPKMAPALSVLYITFLLPLFPLLSPDRRPQDRVSGS